MKKLAIIGKGTAGMLALSHFHRENLEIELYYDPSISSQAVGEGSTLIFPNMLRDNLNFRHSDLSELDGTFKEGVFKSGWGNGKEFMHHFIPPTVAYHFNALKLQDFILKRLKHKIKIIEKNITPEDIDSDFVFSCSGKPNDFEKFTMSDYITVNSVYVNQCYWEYPKFQHTLAIARPYGWVFGIPLKNRCSIGYLYNKDINSLSEIMEDCKEVFEEFGLNSSTSSNSFSFNSYYRKENFVDRVCYGGNDSFFLEPMEASSIDMMNVTQRLAYDCWINNFPIEKCNEKYTEIIQEIESMIMFHYFAGSKYDTKFWQYSMQKAENNMKNNVISNKKFLDVYLKSTNNFIRNDESNFANWYATSIKENFSNLGLYPKFEKLLTNI